MNKKSFFKLLGLCAGLSLAVGAGVALSSGGESKQVSAGDVTDTITAADLAATSTTYTIFSGVSLESNAVYAGNSAKDSSSNIQLRSKNSNSGIVSTTSGGKVKSVKITVGSGSNTVDIYGSNKAYTAASDLYDNNKKGTKVGSVSATGNVTFTDDYTYVGIRSNNGAIYLNKVEITWDDGSGGANDSSSSQESSSNSESGSSSESSSSSEQPIETYSITYDSNGGSGTMTDSNSPYAVNTATTIIDSSFTAPSGKEFHHWNTSKDNTGTTYFPGDPLTVTADKTLYAIWVDAVSGNGSIVFKDSDSGNDSTSETTDVNVLWNNLVSGQGYVKSISSPSKVYQGGTGLKLGTGSAAGKFTINFAPSKSSSLNGKVLWATLKKYGSDPINLNFTSSSINSGSAVEIPTSSLSDYSEIEIGTFSSAPTSITIETSTKRAYFKSLRFADAPTEYTVTFDTNGGNEIAASDVTIGQSLELPTPTRANYHFLGWKLITSGNPSGDYLESPYTPTGNCTIQAQWTSDVLHVTYDANGGTNAPTDSTVYHYDASVTVAGVGEMTKSHNTFAGWNTKADGSGTYYAANAYFNITSDITLYAKWTVNAVTSLVNVNDSVPTKTVYDAGDTFDPSGLVIHAVYQNEGEDSTNISDLIDWGELVYQATSVTGSYGGQSITISGLTINAAPGTEDKPYNVAQARAAIDSGSGVTEVYATGIISQIATPYNSQYGNISFDISIDGSTTNDQLRAYRLVAHDEFTIANDGDVNVGDRVTVFGSLKKYNSIYEFDAGCYMVAQTKETKALSLSVDVETLTKGSQFSYSGTVTTAYTVKANSDVTNSVTYSGYDMNKVEDQTVTVTYADPTLGNIIATYTLKVIYADVTTVKISGDSSINMTQKDEHPFTATLNDNVSPESTIIWHVADSVGSLVDNREAYFEGNVLKTDTSKEGTLIVTATCGEVTSNNAITVYVTGNPVPTLNANDLYGFKGDDGSLVANVNGGTAPYTYSWNLPEDNGVAVIDGASNTDNVSINYNGRGETTITLTVKDSNNKEGTVTASIHVTETLNLINAISHIEHDETYVAVEQGYTKGDLITSYNGTDFSIAFNKASAGTAPTFYDNKAPFGVRVYAKGEMVVSSSHNITKIELSCSASDGNTFSVDNGELSGNTWLGEATSVKFTTSGTKGNIGVSSVKVYWTETTNNGKITETNYFAQDAVIEFAESLTSKLNEVCDAVYGTDTDLEDLASKWTEIKGVYDAKVAALAAHDSTTNDNSLEVFELLIKHAVASDANDADKLQKALSSYNYVYAKYHTVLDAEGVGGDFLTGTGKSAVSYSASANPISIFAGTDSSSSAIIVVISMMSAMAIGGFFFLRSRKEQ